MSNVYDGEMMISMLRRLSSFVEGGRGLLSTTIHKKNNCELEQVGMVGIIYGTIP